MKNDIYELHTHAMNLADEADSLKHSNKQESVKFYSQAFEKERQAAMLSCELAIDEPTPSVLLRSAACLAYESNLLRESEKLIGLALSRNNVPCEIAEELRDLLENVNFGRHLNLKGVVLADNELQLVVAGNGIANGMASQNDVYKRLDAIKHLSIRTLERKYSTPFRKHGRPSNMVLNQTQTFLSIPRAASFAISIRIGNKNEEPSLFDDIESRPTALIDDIATNLQLINDGNVDLLRQRIPDKDYLVNFVSQAKELAPDGEDVNLVGVTYVKEGNERKVPMTRQKNDFKAIEDAIFNPTYGLATQIDSNSFVEEIINGTFSAADAKDNILKVSVGDKIYKIVVPDGLTDIVKSYFNEIVSVRTMYNKSKNEWTLLSVDPLETRCPF